MNKEYKKGQKWWEISRNPDPKKAFWEEMNEMLEEARWWRKNFWNFPGWYPTENKGYTSQEDINNFWKKWSEGGHFWHSKNKRWYSEKWWKENK